MADRFPRLCLYFLVVLLASCASQRTKDDLSEFNADPVLLELHQWQINGRLALSNGRDGGSGELTWVHLPDSDEIRFHAALGQGSWRLLVDSDSARLLQVDGQTLEAASVSQLIENHLQWDIPVDLLLDWIRGLPSSYPISALDLDINNRIREMVQSGWRVEYGGYYQVEDLTLPRKITVSRGGDRVRLLIRQWTIDR